MKVLWFCNGALSDVSVNGTGTWLGATANGLLESDGLELGVIALSSVKSFTRHDYRHVKQWYVPAGARLGRDGLPSATLVQSIVAAANEFSPDIIHVWGTESFWGLLSARNLLKYPALLEIQGLKGPYSKVYCGDLTFWEQILCLGVKEVLKRKTMQTERRKFANWGFREKEIIRGHRFIDVQSPWVVAQVSASNPAARLFSVELVLRKPFYEATAWCLPQSSVIFCTAAYSVPYKGLHVAIRALCLLRKRIPNARLRIAGGHQRVGIRQDGYMRWINRIIKKLGLTNAVEWLGPLDAVQIVAELKNAAAVVIPTFCETYCVAFAEAMTLGVPAVVSFTGGTAYLGRDEDSCLFFPPGDEVMCAYQLERVMTDKMLATRLSLESRKIAAVRNDRKRIVQRQLEIYQQVMTSR
ncbi:MAG: glycosyltransferase [bacterium]